jgi:hypothetical protein
MRRRQAAYAQELERANKLTTAKVESSQGRACPTCGAALGRDSRPPVEGIDGDSRRNSLKNPRGPKSRV